MQKEMEKMQEELNTTPVEGSAGGGVFLGSTHLHGAGPATSPDVMLPADGSGDLAESVVCGWP